MDLHAAGVLSGLAALAVLPTRALKNAELVLLMGAAIAGLWLADWLLAPSMLGYLIALCAGLVLARPRWGLLAVLFSGLFTGVWAEILVIEGLPFIVALLAAAVPLSLAVWLAKRRASFADATARDEAAILVAVLALALTAGAEVVDGWRSAVALRETPIDTVAVDVEPWVGSLAVACFVLGAVYSSRKRKGS